MNINFRKNITKSYMIIENVKKFSTLDFETKMILSNKINTLLPSDYEVIDDKVNFLYDISSKQAFSKILEISKLNFESLRAFIFALKSLAQAIDEHLLDANNVILKEGCIFSDMHCREFSFCYFPYYHGDFAFELKELFNKIINVINYGDEKAVRLAYHLIEEVQNENFVIANLLDCFEDISDSIETAEEDLEDLPIEVFEYVTNNPVAPPLSDGDFGPLAALAEDNFYYENVAWKEPKKNTNNKRTPKKSQKIIEIDNTEELSVFEKIAIYVRNKSFFEIVDDIDNGDIINNIKSVVAQDRYISPMRNNLNLSQSRMQPALEGVPIPAFEFKELSGNFEFEKPQDGTVLLGRNENRNRRLQGVNASVGQCFEIKRMPYTIGKMNDKADAIINSRTISRLHARIYEESKTSGKYTIEDLNSTNGTFVNYKRIEPYQKVPIAVGDIICFADEEFCFK